MDHVSHQHQHDAGHARHVGRWLIAGAVLVALLVGLGVWQLQRRTAKLALIAQVERNLTAAPVPAPSAATAADAYRPVLLRGRFQHDRETRVKAVTARGAGFWLMTPLVGARGTVLVNRGFVIAQHPSPGESRGGACWTDPVPIQRPTGIVTVVGLLRLSEPGGGFLRANDPAADRWFSRDVAAIARAKGLGKVVPYFVDAGAGGGYPVGGLTVVAFRNNHLLYALTWFALAGLVGWAMWRLVRLPR